MKKIFQGMLVGLGKIIPGVSGSIIAISLGIYEEAIYAINNIFKDPKKSIKFLIPIGLGIIISIIFSSKIIYNMLDNYFTPTILFFLGLIVGGVKDVVKETKKKYILITIISFIIVVFLGLMSSENETNFDNLFYQFLFFFFIGMIDAATMVIPGISGTAVLMMLGSYNTIIRVISNLTNIQYLFNNFLILLPFLLGIIVGIFITVKLINYLYDKHYHKTYNGILGFLLATIVYMFMATLKSNYTLSQIVVGILLFIIGYIMTNIINR